MSFYGEILMTKKQLRKNLYDRLMKTTHCYQEVPFIVDAIIEEIEKYEKENKGE